MGVLSYMTCQRVTRLRIQLPNSLKLRGPREKGVELFPGVALSFGRRYLSGLRNESP